MNSHIASSQIVKDSLRPANGIPFNVWLIAFCFLIVFSSALTVLMFDSNAKETEDRVAELPVTPGRVSHGKVTHSPDANPQVTAVTKQGELTVIKTNVVTTVSDSELKCLYKNAFYEAGVEGVVGSLAVSQIVMQRLEHRAWGNGVCNVIYSPRQFSWTAKATLEVPTGTFWSSAKEGVDAYLRGYRIKELENAMYYHASWMERYPKWSKAMTQVAAIGNHIFYEH